MFALAWTGIVKFFTDNPIARWIGLAVVALLGWEAMKRHLKEAGRQAERHANAEREAKTRTEMIERKSEIVAQERQNADQAIAARDSGSAPATFDELSDTDKAIAAGRARSRFERSP